jgi:hypothetical protein
MKEIKVTYRSIIFQKSIVHFAKQAYVIVSKAKHIIEP